MSAKQYKAVYWSIGDEDGRLTHKDPDEAIEAHLDSIRDQEQPIEVTAIGYERIPADVSGRCILNSALEQLDSDYADPDGDDTKPTPAMLAAADELARVINAEYMSWACRPNGETYTVNVADWVKEHCPHWLEAKEPQT